MFVKLQNKYYNTDCIYKILEPIYFDKNKTFKNDDRLGKWCIKLCTTLKDSGHHSIWEELFYDIEEECIIDFEKLVGEYPKAISLEKVLNNI